MQYFLFIYTIVITLLYGACGFDFLILFRRKQNKRDFWLSFMFFLFICDNLIYAMTEFIPDFHAFYQRIIIYTPILNNLITIGMIICHRMVLAYMLNNRPGNPEKLLSVILLVLLILLTLNSDAHWGRVIYNLLNQAIMLAIFLQGFWALHHFRTGLGEKWHCLIFWLLLICTVSYALGSIESTAAVLLDRLKFGSFRILGFEIFGLFCTAVAIWYLFIYLDRSASPISDHELLKLFIGENHLTPREAELIPLLLSGASNASICDEKCISLNTVKVHTHNIYQKLGIQRRSQLAAKYEEFKKRRCS